MANDTGDKPTKDGIAEGMSESGKGVPPTTGGAGRTSSGGTDDVAGDVAESGSGAPSADEDGAGAGGGKR